MKQIEKLVGQIAELKGYATNKSQAIEMGLSSYIDVEFNSAYGGYRVVMVNISNGGHFGALGESASCTRKSKGAMMSFLEGYINALS